MAMVISNLANLAADKEEANTPEDSHFATSNPRNETARRQGLPAMDLKSVRSLTPTARAKFRVDAPDRKQRILKAVPTSAGVKEMAPYFFACWADRAKKKAGSAYLVAMAYYLQNHD